MNNYASALFHFLDNNKIEYTTELVNYDIQSQKILENNIHEMSIYIHKADNVYIKIDKYYYHLKNNTKYVSVTISDVIKEYRKSKIDEILK
jgi:hypothetical protein